MTRSEQRGGKRNFWTAEDDQTLRDGFGTMTLAELCRVLGREPQAVGLRCGKLGLTARETIKPAALHQVWRGVVQ